MTKGNKAAPPNDIPLAVPPGIQPVFAAFLDWLRMERRVSPNTVSGYSRDLGSFFTFTVEHTGEDLTVGVLLHPFRLAIEKPVQSLRLISRNTPCTH